MAATITKPTRRRQRWLIAALVSASIAALLVGRAYLQNVGAQALAREIRRKGGEVYFQASFLDNIGRWWSGEAWSSDTQVVLRGQCLDSTWLRERNYLADLPTTSLVLNAPGLDADVASALIETHPLKSFAARGQHDADAIAAALAKKPRMLDVDLFDSDLTDGGLRTLHLEHMIVLNVGRTRVSSLGLSQRLQHTKHVLWLGLDGTQFDQSLVGSLQQLPPLHSLALIGADVHDEHVQLINSLQPPKHLYLLGTSLTKPALDTLAKNMPATAVHVLSEPSE